MDAVIYARISKDSAGQGLGVRRQEKACRDKATALGWTVSEVYVDNDVSASRNVPRPEYERLMVGIRDGGIRALVVYDLDRLTRKPAELEEFITLADGHGIALANVSGDVDLTNANGRMIARIKGAVARQEAERLSERSRAQKQQRAEMGLPMAARYRLFGYTREWTVLEDEAEVVREVYHRVLAGEAKNTISRDLAERGVKTTSGAEWNRGQTNRLIAQPIYAGIYMLKGERVGHTSVPSLVDEATYSAVNDGMQRFGAGHNTRKYLLSGFLVCDVCKVGMVGNQAGGRRRYRCNHLVPGACGRLSIKADWVDDVLNNYMTNMQAIDVGSQQPEQPDLGPQIDAVDAEVESLHAAHRAGDLGLEDLMTLLKDRRSRRSDLVKAQAEVVDQATFYDGAYEWQDMDLAARRARIGHYFQHIFLRPVTKSGSRKFDENRLYALRADGRVMHGIDFNVINPLTGMYVGQSGLVDGRPPQEDGVRFEPPPRRVRQKP
ncbi:MAG: recombinase family protein [Propionibacteriales bacterium]|nr:recombinase family protein [Propionibacteriales bacterium]